MGYVCLLARA